MKDFALKCVKSSIVILKANLVFIVIFELLKYSSRGVDTEKNPVLNNEDSLAQKDALHNKLTSSTDFMSRLTWLYALNSDLIDITKIDHVQFLTNSTGHNKPIIKLKTLINISEIIEFSMIKNCIKIALVFNINLMTILINILLLAYLIFGQKKSTSQFLFSVQLCINLFLFITIIPFNLINMKRIGNQLGVSTVFSKLNRKVLTCLDQFFLKNKVDLDSLGLKSDDYVLIEANSDMKLSQTNMPQKNMENLAISNFNLNLFFMVFSICSLGLFSYLIKEKNDFQDTIKQDVESQSDTFWKIKCKKLKKKSNNSLKLVIQSVFVIFFLSIWDIVDVLQFYRINSWESSYLNFFNPQVSNYAEFLADLSRNKLSINTTSKSIQMASNYFNRYDDSFYRQYFSHSEIKYNYAGKKLQHGFKVETKIKGLFVSKMHAQFASDMLIILLSFGCCYFLSFIEKYLEWLDNKKIFSMHRKYFI